ncbi:PhzF family phenazine biosynthesis protein [Pseudonocardia lacus]|uniref:PhzF family phenazine biosynthesis protein n=1 Tax=Pseudonocardia lacus TaxID=2835865 RepID=UPI001BDCF4F4|nr:PhzF family phenazine biosynthesis protein [Pseudonocardia lacus]
MTGLRYEIVDVFTDRVYAGNPLAVVHGGTDLSTAQMQAVAKEFNLSETTFVLPPTTPDADYRLRIFTPGSELPFAGHPSVGSAWALAAAGLIRTGAVVQECGAGLLPVRVDAEGARVNGGAPQVGRALDGAAFAAAVGLTIDDLDPAVPPGAAAAGVRYAFVPVRPDAVARCEVDPAGLRRALAAADLGGSPGVHVVSFDRERSHAHARMFAPEVGVVEDPATGSAAVALAVFLVDRGLLPADGGSAFTVEQGIEMGRPSRMDVTVRAEAGAAVETSVGGRAALVARGELVALP